MVKVDINQQEIAALQQLMKDAQVPIDMGYILGCLKNKIAEAWQKEQKARAKQALAAEDVPKSKVKSCAGCDNAKKD